MVKQRSGAIVNISSTAANGFPGLSAYGASKAAMNSLTRGLAREVAPLGIRVNAVAPSWTQTEMTESIASNPKVMERIKRIPLGRIARADEVAAVVAALVRDEMSYVIGQTIGVDGGAT
jgi:3-oxoacyl-[acyl-carrier protein] reductase